jgi:hypothetical protein
MFKGFRRKPAMPRQAAPRTRFTATATVLNGVDGLAAFMTRTVGVRQYQPAIRAIADGWRAQHPGADLFDAELFAALYPEPTNPYDRQAIQVQIDGTIVGYLSREEARAYYPVLRQLAQKDHFAACRAHIVGGRADAPT